MRYARGSARRGLTLFGPSPSDRGSPLTSRRDFIAGSAGSLAGLIGAPSIILANHAAHDLVIRGGNVIDGTGAAAVEMDVAIAGGRVASIAKRIADKGTVEIDARGMAVAPGFIDIHSHADGSLFSDPRSESVIRQGVTTIVVGQDGSGRFPSRRSGDEDGGYASFAALAAAVDKLPSSVNVASMIGLGSIRGIVVGADDRPATPAEISRMTGMVRDAVASGACGASSGLEYTPGAFASRAELAALCAPLAAARLPYATHMRNEDDRLLDAIDESIAVARNARCPLQISHLKTQGPRNWGKLDEVFKRIDDARKGGMDIMFDRYPYIAYQTGLTNLFPVWSRDGGTAAFFKRLDDASTSDRIKRETLAKIDLIGGWDNVLISGVARNGDTSAEGKRLGAFAKSKGTDPYDATVTLLRSSNGSVGMVGFAMSEDNLERILAHPLGMVCSDGGGFATDGASRRGSPHPRGLGTFPRVLGRYVRERKALTLEQAVRKMTALPASRIRLGDRGRLAPKLAADVVVFDPATVSDKATFEDPFQYPEGIKAVVVNGAVSFRDGERTKAAAGKALRPS
ncbi:MAG TPA: D-aminoacylase [Gemmatimonadaceae bacterium]|nr:D-aminoacylase [Gemmatimonadaceae bacterium]